LVHSSPCKNMLLLHVKRSEKESFLYETPAATEVEAALFEIVKIQNLRLKVGRLTAAAEGLAMHGPMKPPEQQGLEDDTPLLEDFDEKSGAVAARAAPERTQNYRHDPSERRTGNAPPDEIAAVVTRTVEDAKALISERQVQMKQKATSQALDEAINNIRGAVMIAYPMGLPDYDGVRQILEERELLEGAASLEVLDPAAISLWCFSKELQRDKLLSDYVGKNDKTKVVAKLQKKGAGAPQREPVVSEDEQKAMIAFYHKKQKEAEKLDAEDDDAYMHSAWANPKSLKNAFSGVGEVSWRGTR